MRAFLSAKTESEFRTSWQQTRFLAWASGHWKQGTREIDIIRFPWEKTYLEELEDVKKIEDKWIWNKPNLPAPNA